MAIVAKGLTHRFVDPAFVGSSPIGRPSNLFTVSCGSGSAVEHRLAKARVAGFIPVFRSILYNHKSLSAPGADEGFFCIRSRGRILQALEKTDYASIAGKLA